LSFEPQPSFFFLKTALTSMPEQCADCSRTGFTRINSPLMTNTTYTGDAGLQGTTRGETPPAAKRLVLIVEDHADTRFLLRYLLEEWGYQVIEAEDGEDAILQAAAFAPDLILMDASLPRADGFNATRRIRKLDQIHTVPIVFLSGHVYPADRAAAFAAGCDDYLVKPLDIDQLNIVLEKRLKPQDRREERRFHL
jgi:CheY-like chemotaxis protein